MICVYDRTNKNFDNNGNAVLEPTSAKVRMIAGGNYDLSLEHPIDPEGKWKHLIPGAVIRVPVPEEEIENAFVGYAVDVYETTEDTELLESPEEATTVTYPTWNTSTVYEVGDKVTYDGQNYICTYWDGTAQGSIIPPNAIAWWEKIANRTDGAASLVSLPEGTQLYLVESVDSTWYKMSTYYGVVGYIKKSRVEFVEHLDPEDVEPRIITEQLLRITNATVDSKNRKVSVTAQHVSYDLNGIIVRDVELNQASPAMAIGKYVEAFMMKYRGTVATNLTGNNLGTYTETIKGKTGMYGFLDPDKGIAAQFDAAFKRDNWDLFIMKKTTTNRGFRLAYSKNMLGVNWTRKSDSLITRIVPVAKDAKGENLYLPEKWVDSSRIGNYPVIRMEQLNVSGQVGKSKDDSGSATWTESDLLDEMRAKANERFTVDKVDRVQAEVTVDFEMMGSTEEYPELKGLEKVLLYDTVEVENPEIGLSATLTVTELEWDAIKKKITALKLSNVKYNPGRNTTGYNVQNKSIGNEKLSDEVHDSIINQVRDIIPEYADPQASRPATVTVTDNDPTLAWGTRSKVGTVQGTDLHVTMPGNPASASDNDPTLAWGTRSKVGSVGNTDLHVTMPGNPVDGLAEDTNTPTDNDYTVKVGSPSKKIKFSKVWEYIKSKILGYTQSNKNYPVQADSNGKMYVNVPWTADGGNAATVNSHTVAADVPSNAVFTDTWRPVQDNLTSTSTTDSLSAKQGKVLNDSTVKLTGNQTISGNKYFSDAIVKKSASNPAISFMGADLSSISAYIYAYQVQKTGQKYGNPRFWFRHYSPNSDGSARTDYYEDFRLPTVDTGRTKSDAYDILTTKENAVVDNLNSSSSTNVLSAKQGKVLSDTLGKLVNTRYLLEPNTTQTITLGNQYCSYLVTTFRNMWFVQTQYNSDTPTVQQVLSDPHSGFTCVAQANNKIKLGTTESGGDYAFTITRLCV